MIKHIYWKSGTVYVLDQRRLPAQVRYASCRDSRAIADAIASMLLRGAPLIGCAAAYGYALEAHRLKGASAAAWRKRLESAGALLRRARPTAVNLMHAVDRMSRRAEELLASGAGARSLAAALKKEADLMFQEDIEANGRMARFGADLLPPDATVMTICNTGTLATCGVGTALGVIREAFRRGKIRRVYALETRPYLQGSRLTMWELAQDKIPATLITDNMAAHIMKTEKIDAVLTGADRVAANGDAANKIGTYGLAVLASYHEIPFYVVAPMTTHDPDTPRGEDIVIEERGAEEVLKIQGLPIAPRGAQARHPSFDVTPRSLITAIVSDKGVEAISACNRASPQTKLTALR